MKKKCDYMNYWLFKSEPSDYSFEDLMKDKETEWEGIRNYQARNFIRDKIKIDDEILFYHSMISAPHVVGIAKVTSKAYPDFFALDNTLNIGSHLLSSGLLLLLSYDLIYLLKKNAKDKKSGIL